MNIVYCTDDKGAFLLLVSMYSLLANNSNNDITIIIIDDGIKEKNRNYIRKVAHFYNRTVFFVPIKKMEFVESYYSKKQWPNNIFSRLFLCSILHEISIDRCIYLDTDTIIEKDLADLWLTNMSGKTCAAVIECMPYSHKKILGLNEEDRYYNSGVILMDLKKWNERHYEQKCERYIERRLNYLIYPDEGTMNAVLKNDIYTLGVQYNVTTLNGCYSFDELKVYRKSGVMYKDKEYELARNDPTIIHFTNNFLFNRPWKKLNKHRHAFHDRWIYYLKEVESILCADIRPKTESSFRVRECVESLVSLFPRNLTIHVMGMMYCYVRPLFINVKGYIYEKSIAGSRI